jgi:hypothetical protein
MNGFTDDQVIELRKGSAAFDHEARCFSKIYSISGWTKEKQLLNLKPPFNAGYNRGKYDWCGNCC